MEEEYLSHHGILGQKWGVRRYQNKDGSLTSEGRKRRGLSDKKERKSLSKKIGENREQKKAEAEAERHEKLKRTVRDHPEKLYKHRYEFSDEEIAKLVTDIGTDTKLKEIRDTEVKRKWEKVKKVSENLGTVKNLANNAKDIYNLAADVQNSMIDFGKMTGPKMMKIGSKPESKRDTTYDQYQKWVQEENVKMLEKAKNGQLTQQEIKDWNATLNNLNNMVGLPNNKKN